MDRLLGARRTKLDKARLQARAAQEVRPAVIIRKISAGHRTIYSARTHMILASVLRTGRRRGIEFSPRSVRLRGRAGPVWADLFKVGEGRLRLFPLPPSPSN